MPPYTSKSTTNFSLVPERLFGDQSTTPMASCLEKLLLVFLTLFLLPGSWVFAAQTIRPVPEFTQIHAASPAPPIQTAAAILRQTFTGAGQSQGEPGAGSILLGTTADSPAIARWVKAGRLTLQASDAYELAMIDGCLIVNGATPRAVLYGTFELQDIVAEHHGVPDNLRIQAKPSFAQRLLHPRVRGSFANYRQSDFEFLARCGGNVAHLNHDWMAEKTLFSFVPSTEFPPATDAPVLERNRARLRQYLDWCSLYGLDGAMWLCEIPTQGGPWTPEPTRQKYLERFPAACLSETGTNQGKVLCLADPRVEREYRRMVRQFLTDFPGISMFLVFTLDSNGELCDPATCPRHHGVSKLTQYNRLLALMAEEGRKVRADFQVFSVAWSWKFRNEPDYFAQQAALPAGAGLATLPDAEAWSFDRKTTDFLRRSRALAAEHHQTFLGYDIFFWGDDTVFREKPEVPLPPGITQLYDFPLGIAAKLQRWSELGADGFFDQWGTMAEYVQPNAVALRELVFHPENTAPDKRSGWALSLATRRFGATAAPKIVAAWGEIEAAQQIQCDHTYYWHHLRPEWAGPTLKTPLTVEALQKVTLAGGEPPKPSGDKDYSPAHDDLARAKALTPALHAAATHFDQALDHLQAALPLVGEESKSTLDHWYPAAPGAPALLTPRKLLEEQIIAVRLQARFQERLSRFFQAYILVKTLPSSGTPEYSAAVATLQQLAAADEAAKVR